MKKLTVLTMAPVALAMASSVVVAAPPAGFSYDDYTVAGGTISAGCPVGFTCTNLDATGNGILQQRVTDGTDTFFRTIVVEEGITAADLAAVQGMGFRNESYVGTEDSAGQESIFGVVQGNGPLQVAVFTDTSAGTGTLAVTSAINDTFYTMAEISDTGIVLEQENLFDTGNQTSSTGVLGPLVATRGANFSATGGSNNLDMRIDVVQPANEGQITIRKAQQNSTVAAAGNLSLADAGGGTLAYSSGDNLQVVWLEQAASGVGSAFDRVLGQQIYTNLTTGTEIRANNADGNGNFVVTNTGAGNPVDGAGPWNWDAALFGTEPVPYLVNGAGTGTALPVPAMATFPD